MITLSTRGRYATRIMVNLARSPQGEAKSARSIAEEEDISVDYIEQLLVKLKSAGFIKSRRGKHGGSLLARPADGIRVSELLDLMEGDTVLVPCLEERCEREETCPTRPLWKKANDALRRVFEGTTIGDLAQGKGLSALSFHI